MKKVGWLSIFGIAMILAFFEPDGTPSAVAGFFPQQNGQLCMANAAGFALNCTANDIQVSRVANIKRADGQDGPVECTLGGNAVFKADVDIVTTAKNRYDYTIYLPEGNWSPQDFNIGNTCSILVGEATNSPGKDLENTADSCADISKPPGKHTYSQQVITLNCQDSDGDGRAEFRYCAAWDNQADSEPVCDGTVNTTPVPGSPSKCRCDQFNIDVFVKPEPPVISKSEATPTTHSEPGWDYIFTLEFTNSSKTSSLFIERLDDLMDTDGDGVYETTLDLWGQTTTVNPQDPATAEGVYLKQGCRVPENGGEVPWGQPYSCNFIITIVDRDLPDIPAPELYKDVIKVALKDKNNDWVIDGESCLTVGLVSVAGEHCSTVKEVQVTNLPPAITVTKTSRAEQVLEPGGDVTFDIEITSTSGSHDAELTIKSLIDDVFGDLNGKGTCVTGGTLTGGIPYRCSFTGYVAGNVGYVHTDMVTVTAVDNEGDEAVASDSATVNVNDVPSTITLEKTADPSEVGETGDDPNVFRDVQYTFQFGVDKNGVDAVTFSSLDDNQFGDLTGDCLVTVKNGESITETPLNGFTLSPGETASCVITVPLQGNAGAHVNVATIIGTDGDGVPLTDSDDATVTFLDTGLSIQQEFALKAPAFVRITNSSVETATITALSIKGINLVEGGSMPGQFEILNEPGSSYDGATCNFCTVGTTIAPGARYDCNFTLKLFPGFELGNIEQADGLTITLEDDEGNPYTTNVGISFQTQE